MKTNWKKAIVIFAAIAFICLSACNLQTFVPNSGNAIVTAVALTMSAQPGPSAVMTPTGNILATNTTCNNMSLYLPPTLASGSTCNSGVDEGMGPGNSTVHADQLTLQGYALSGRPGIPQVLVYSVQGIQQAVPSFTITYLQTLINGQTPGEQDLPYLPIGESAQMIRVKYKVIPFNNGSGIRYLMQQGQSYWPINNQDIFYTFQGLTSDGKYWISARLPISNPILPENGNTLPNGESMSTFTQNFSAYIAALTSQLNAQADDSFSPTITALDALISSITIQE